MESSQSIVLGDVEIFRVLEWQGPLLPGPDLLPGSTEQIWSGNVDWLVPEHQEPGTGLVVATVQTWVLRSAGRTILIDTGVGNGRDRPSRPLFHRRTGDFLDRLARAGVRPGDVDLVVNTHVHGDHVGWNTVDADGEWVPAFPNAHYLIPAVDDAWFGPANGYARGRRPDDELLYEDSIAPVHRAGRAILWDDSYRVDDNLTLESAPGHTPGSAVVHLASGADRAVFVGDLVHSPLQLLHPACSSCLCQDPEQAATTRHRILERAADTGELVVPAHFAGAGAVEIRRAGTQFTLGDWPSPLSEPRRTP
ncbi:MBL fold metallo-hydrolase [Nocardia sp. alder85J]|uniref:MBL fold metallo-hydrolase n=1 Tax=Nocardia sp. alder85J TaxID=2862949 RepID=UPI001CD61725|nr:MBL fold metallo-hydrolase [Nocardia sp. alder85J]MCX4091383.1 MBL fold metallo-hydrolase [Nocardia sp. alder85J]